MTIPENQETKEKSPITREQIEKFKSWFNKFSNWKTVKIEPGNKETTFKSFKDGDIMCINAKNSDLNETRKYDPKTGIISSIDDQENIQFKHYNPGDWTLDYNGLASDLRWFEDCFPSMRKRIANWVQNSISSALRYAEAKYKSITSKK